MKRWVIQYRPQLEEALHRRQRPVGVRWRMAATSLQVKGPGRALERAVEQPGPPMAVLRTEQRDPAAARRCLTQAIRRHGLPESMTMDGSDANAAAIQRSTAAPGTAIALRQVQYVHNLGEQEHRGGKWGTRSMVGGQAFAAAQAPWSGAPSCPCARNARGWWRPETRASRRPHCATPSLRNLSPDRGTCPFIAP